MQTKQTKRTKPEWLVTLEKQVSAMDHDDLLYSKAVYVCKHAAEIFETHMNNIQEEEGLAQSELYNEYFNRTRMYLKHFFISFAMMVERGEISESYYSFYEVDADIAQKLNDITDVELEDFCNKVIKGEDERIRKTETQRVFNPSSVQLQAQYDIFHSYFEMLQILREHSRKSRFALDAVCAEANNLSLRISK